MSKNLGEDAEVLSFGETYTFGIIVDKITLKELNFDINNYQQVSAMNSCSGTVVYPFTASNYYFQYTFPNLKGDSDPPRPIAR